MAKEPNFENDNHVTSTGGAIVRLLGSAAFIGFGSYVAILVLPPNASYLFQLKGSALGVFLGLWIFSLSIVIFGVRLSIRALLFLVTQHRRGHVYMEVSPSILAPGRDLFVTVGFDRSHDKPLDGYAKLVRYIARDPDRLEELARKNLQLQSRSKMLTFQFEIPRDAPASDGLKGYLLYVGFNDFKRAPLVRSVEIERKPA